MKSEILQLLLRAGESETLDFKQTIAAHKVARTLVAFANTKGGTILIGVTDHKQLIGIDPEEEKFVIEQAMQYCSPPLAVEFEIFEEEGKSILAVYVAEGQQKPYFALDSEGLPHAFFRQHDKNKLL